MDLLGRPANWSDMRRTVLSAAPPSDIPLADVDTTVAEVTFTEGLQDDLLWVSFCLQVTKGADDGDINFGVVKGSTPNNWEIGLNGAIEARWVEQAIRSGTVFRYAGSVQLLVGVLGDTQTVRLVAASDGLFNLANIGFTFLRVELLRRST